MIWVQLHCINAAGGLPAVRPTLTYYTVSFMALTTPVNGRRGVFSRTFLIGGQDGGPCIYMTMCVQLQYSKLKGSGHTFKKKRRTGKEMEDLVLQAAV